MKNIRFTQTVEVILTFDASVPDSWTDEDITDFVSDSVVGITVDDLDDSANNESDAIITGLSVDGKNIIDNIVWEVSN